MEIDIILVDGEEVQKKVNQELQEFQEESDEDKIERLLHGDEGKRKVFTPKIDVRDYANVHRFTFRLDDVISIYKAKTTFRGGPVSVVNVAGREYDWIHEEEIYEKIRQYLNSKDE